jgi:hypothetical protein
MNDPLTRGARWRRTGLKLAIASTLVASIGIAYAFKTVFARPGEAALRFVPADALMVGTIDLSPSPQQALAFKRIDDAMDRNGLNRFAETNVLDIFSKKSPATDALRPLVLRNGALAMLPRKDASGERMVGLAFIAVSSGPDAETVLKKFGKPTFFRGTKGYTLPGDSSPMMVMDDLLVLGQEPYSLHMARMVRDQQVPGILSLPEFTEVREKVASDANVMAFFSPKNLSQTGVAAVRDAKASWLAAGLAIRDGGIGLSVWNRFDPATVKGLTELGQTQGIRKDLMSVLPNGAYGMMVLSQPGNYFEMFERSAGQESDGPKMIGELADNLRQNVGLDLHKDVVGGLKGNAVIAAYPTTDQTEGADLLLMVDDMNGADPAAAVDRFQSFIDEQNAKEGNSEKFFVESKLGNARMFRVPDRMEEDMRKGLSGDLDEHTVKTDVMFGKKTVAWAMVGKGILAATDEGLLKRAVECYESRTNNLAGDATFLKDDAEVMDGSQLLAIFNLGRIAAGVKNTVSTEKMDRDGAEMFNTILSAFSSLGEPFYLKAKVGQDGQVAGGAFIPLDYDKVFDFIGKQMKEK